MTESRLKAVLLVALLVVFATGLFAQPKISVTTTSGTSTVTQTLSPAPKAPVTGKKWEGPRSTDYYTFEQGSQLTPPNPQIAVGPDSILAIVNRTIVHYKNPNSIDNSLVTDPNNNPPTNQIFLSVWLGALQNKLCPTFPRDNKSCVIDNASVKYDQMQGRFVVAFTVVDSGIQAGRQDAPAPTVRSFLTRKASWVVIVSKYAQLNLPSTGNTTPFTDPNPPTKGSTGGVSSSNWLAFTGDLNDLTTPTGNWNGDEIGSYPYTPAGATTPIDCTATAVAAAVPATNCFLPTGLRVGLDNNNVVVTAAVINDNVALAARADGTAAAYAGARVRVYRKKTLYTWAAPTTLSRWTSTNATANFVDLADTTAPFAGETVHELDANDPNVLPNGLVPVFYEPNHLRGRAIASFDANFASGCFIYQNQPTSSSANPCDDSNTYMVGAVATNNLGVPQTKLYVRGIQVVPAGAVAAGTASWTATLLTNTAAAVTVNVPGFANPGATANTDFAGGKGGIPASAGTIPQLVSSASGTVCADGTVEANAANAAKATAGFCTLYVGDDRPQTVIYREGFLYVARAGQTTNAFLADGGKMLSTVIYDVIRKYRAVNATGQPSADPMEVLYSYWQNGNFWAPMYESPANVINYGSVSPISIFPWLEKLFVSTNYNYAVSTQPSPTTNVKILPSLFDMRQGVDFYDTLIPFVNPVTGAVINRNVFGTRGGASTDPNDGSLWNFGAYAQGREYSIIGPGQWGTYVANYGLTLQSTDPYGNSTALYSDISPSYQFFQAIQIARNVGIGPSGSTFGDPDVAIKRNEMAKWVVLSQMDEAGIDAYLNATGGCYTSFADVPPNCSLTSPANVTTAPPSSGQMCSSKGVSGSGSADAQCGFWRYIETMYRRGYTKGCTITNDPRASYCPNDNLTRGQMAVFIIRAKMNNVFPTVLSGCPTGQTCADTGDNFGDFFNNTSFFTDVPSSDPFSPYINKMRELRITNGTDNVAKKYSPGDNLTRGQIAQFMVRAFFY